MRGNRPHYDVIRILVVVLLLRLQYDSFKMMQARSMILARLRSPSRMVVCRPPHWNHPVNHAGLRSVATTSTIQTEQVLVSKTKAPLETPSGKWKVLATIMSDGDTKAKSAER